jgi:hypothetical protein
MSRRVGNQSGRVGGAVAWATAVEMRICDA